MPEKCKCGKPGIVGLNGKDYCLECFDKTLSKIGKIIRGNRGVGK